MTTDRCWADDHRPEERYQVEQKGLLWHIIDTVSPARMVAICNNPQTARWVAIAIDHYIHGAPGTAKRRIHGGS